MTQSTYRVQYHVPPPDVPDFLSHRATHLQKLIEWSKAEHRRWLIYCAEHGYFRGVKYFNEEVSPISILATMHGFRKICANIKPYEWNLLSSRERVFIRRAYELRDVLLGD